MRNNIMDLTGTTLMAAGGSLGISALGGSAKPVSNAMRFMSPMGTMIGVGGLMRTMKKVRWR